MAREAEARGGWYGIDALDRWRADRAARGLAARLDVVLMTHPRDERDLVRLLYWTEKMSSGERRAVAHHMRPVLGEVISADRLQVGLLFLPLFADEIMHPSTRRRCRDLLKREGMSSLRDVGAGVVCLGGLLGGLSGYGRHLEDEAVEIGAIVTTGHALTAISVAKTLARATRELDRSLAGRELAVLGVGSVGWGFARLLCREAVVPEKVTLVDTPRRRRHLEQHAEALRQRGRFEVATELTSVDGWLADDSACFRSPFVISAVSTPNVIDVERVAPGTILVDDSQPYCWSREAAWRRCEARLDVAPCEAGLIDVGALGYRAHFPFDFADHDPARGSQTAWCCLTEGLLGALHPDLPATRGEPDEPHLDAFNRAFEAEALAPAALQCGPYLLPVAALRQGLARSGG